MHETALQILAYLAENPDAGDTAEGIAEWWLPAGAARPPLASVERALAELTAEGWLSASRGVDARTRYRLAPGKADGAGAGEALRKERGP